MLIAIPRLPNSAVDVGTDQAALEGQIVEGCRLLRQSLSLFAGEFTSREGRTRHMLGQAGGDGRRDATLSPVDLSDRRHQVVRQAGLQQVGGGTGAHGLIHVSSPS